MAGQITLIARNGNQCLDPCFHKGERKLENKFCLKNQECEF